jgi:hypothetical protein
VTGVAVVAGALVVAGAAVVAGLDVAGAVVDGVEEQADNTDILNTLNITTIVTSRILNLFFSNFSSPSNYFISELQFEYKIYFFG